jgi:hypothetical protein
MEKPIWNRETAQSWYQKQPWLVGCNYIPSNAINQLEMWQAETFDIKTNRRELTWAASLGFNTVRVYLHDLVWQGDRDGFFKRIGQFLDICHSVSIRPIFVFFDDCWNRDPQPGPQPQPKPGVHNSGWVQSPGIKTIENPSSWGRLQEYVCDTLRVFGRDDRILMWDLYNEPGNKQQDEISLPLLRAVFDWAWSIRPDQPLTAGLWYGNAALNAFQLESSDVISFHNYEPLDNLEAQINRLKVYQRPLICTEYMARPRGSLFATHLPLFKRENVGCVNWGLVSGKTNTIFQWEKPLPDVAEPPLWFHDIFRQDGTPYDPAEIEAIKAHVIR